MIEIDLNEADGIVTITPKGALRQTDFEAIAAQVDPYIEANGKLNGLIIYTQNFPGWEDFAALISHFKFVRHHQQHIKRVAAVTDSCFLSILPVVADHFVAAEVKHFDYTKRMNAVRWIKSA